MQDPTDAHCRDLLPWYAADLLDAAEHAQVARHLASCAACQQVLAQWQEIGAGVNHRLQHITPHTTTAASWERLQSSLSAPSASPNGKHTPMRGTIYMEFDQQSSESTMATPSRPKRSITLALAAVALVVILGSVSFVLFASHGALSSQLRTGSPFSNTSVPSNGAIPPIYLTPGTLVTPAPGNTTPISDVQTSASATNDNGKLKISLPTALFLVGETVNVSFKVQGVKANDVVRVTWYMNNTDLTPSLKQTNANCCSRAFTDDTTTDTVFTIQIPTPGLGKAQIYFNNALAATVLFDVVTPAQLGTPTAIVSH